MNNLIVNWLNTNHNEIMSITLMQSDISRTQKLLIISIPYKMQSKHSQENYRKNNLNRQDPE